MSSLPLRPFTSTPPFEARAERHWDDPDGRGSIAIAFFHLNLSGQLPLGPSGVLATTTSVRMLQTLVPPAGRRGMQICASICACPASAHSSDVHQPQGHHPRTRTVCVLIGS